MKIVGYLVTNPGRLSREESEGRRYLGQQSNGRIIPFAQCSRLSLSPAHHSTLWWHYDSSVELPPVALDPHTISALRDYVQRGGSLLLSLLAAQYVVDLGIEEVRPNIIEKGTWNRHCWAENYPDIRGLCSFRGHPIFDGLHGAAYLWNPTPESSFSGAWYQAPALPKNGRVVAVEREYIKLDEDWRVAVEYSLGKGRILTVGSFMFFADRQSRFKPHLEQFTRNCLEYLSQPHRRRNTNPQKTETRQEVTSSWNFESRTVRFQTRAHQKPIPPPADHWQPATSGLSLSRERASGNFYDLGGRRILIMGSEKAGIQEVWAHPLRILKGATLAFRIRDHTTLVGETQQPPIVVRPESLTRTFQFDDTALEETTFADARYPSGAIHFEVRGNKQVEIMFTTNVDLRIMWPLSDRATGSLEYSWNDGLRAAVVQAPALKATAILGCSHQPAEYVIGRYAEVKDVSGRFTGTPTDSVQVAIGLRYVIDPGTSGCTIAFAGSSVSEREATAAYRRMVTHPLARIDEHARHFKSLCASLPPLDAVEPELRDALHWAVAATDRFYVETPGVGTSLMAGYATTACGWDGGQAISGRPGYAWYFGRDSVWTALAMLAYGDHTKVRSVLEFLGNYQDITGKIPHEVTTSGHVHYDAADSTPLYITLMGRYLRASNDRMFVRREFSKLLHAIDFCFSTDTDGDHLIENTNVGHGWIEGGPLFPAHAEMYLNACWAAALEEAAFSAGVLRRKESRRWKREANRVRHILNEKFWNPETGDFLFALNADGTFNTARTILPAVAMYFGLIDPIKAQQSLAEYASKRFSTEWGVRLVADDDPEYHPEAYHHGSIWPLFTGWLALAEQRYGLTERALGRIERTLMLYKRFALGYIPEALNGNRCEPAGVCPHQAWSEALAILGVLEGRPDLTPSGGILHHIRRKKTR